MVLVPDSRPWEAPYEVSPVKIQIFTLKVENVIRVVMCP
jgi:hypothetical protein